MYWFCIVLIKIILLFEVNLKFLLIDNFLLFWLLIDMFILKLGKIFFFVDWKWLFEIFGEILFGEIFFIDFVFVFILVR